MSLLRTAARASVATRVIGSTHRRQQQRWAALDAASASPVCSVSPGTTADPVAPPSTAEVIQQLTQLTHLREAGALTDEEFASQKKRLLGAS
ncbi:SHOCT domain-containing protein [Microbacterium sp. LjRoot45]|uniref:SHOCT domain-containing protein n=1 Tax=Microbacterium sp. LjRoot45 TaxID=3342329 RepID=UPI003ECD2488